MSSPSSENNPGANANVRGQSVSSNARVRGVPVDNATMRGQSISNASMRETPVVANAGMRGALLSNVSMRGTPKANASMRGTPLSNASMRGEAMDRQGENDHAGLAKQSFYANFDTGLNTRYNQSFEQVSTNPAADSAQKDASGGFGGTSDGVKGTVGLGGQTLTVAGKIYKKHRKEKMHKQALHPVHHHQNLMPLHNPDVAQQLLELKNAAGITGRTHDLIHKPANPQLLRDALLRGQYKKKQDEEQKDLMQGSQRLDKVNVDLMGVISGIPGSHLPRKKRSGSDGGEQFSHAMDRMQRTLQKRNSDSRALESEEKLALEEKWEAFRKLKGQIDVVGFYGSAHQSGVHPQESDAVKFKPALLASAADLEVPDGNSFVSFPSFGRVEEEEYEKPPPIPRPSITGYNTIANEASCRDAVGEIIRGKVPAHLLEEQPDTGIQNIYGDYVIDRNIVAARRTQIKKKTLATWGSSLLSPTGEATTPTTLAATGGLRYGENWAGVPSRIPSHTNTASSTMANTMVNSGGINNGVAPTPSSTATTTTGKKKVNIVERNLAAACPVIGDLNEDVNRDVNQIGEKSQKGVKIFSQHYLKNNFEPLDREEWFFDDDETNLLISNEKAIKEKAITAIAERQGLTPIQALRLWKRNRQQETRKHEPIVPVTYPEDRLEHAEFFVLHSIFPSFRPSNLLGQAHSGTTDEVEGRGVSSTAIEDDVDVLAPEQYVRPTSLSTNAIVSIRGCWSNNQLPRRVVNYIAPRNAAIVLGKRQVPDLEYFRMSKDTETILNAARKVPSAMSESSPNLKSPHVSPRAVISRKKKILSEKTLAQRHWSNRELIPKKPLLYADYVANPSNGADFSKTLPKYEYPDDEFDKKIRSVRGKFRGKKLGRQLLARGTKAAKQVEDGGNKAPQDPVYDANPHAIGTKASERRKEITVKFKTHLQTNAAYDHRSEVKYNDDSDLRVTPMKAHLKQNTTLERLAARPLWNCSETTGKEFPGKKARSVSPLNVKITGADPKSGNKSDPDKKRDAKTVAGRIATCNAPKKIPSTSPTSTLFRMAASNDAFFNEDHFIRAVKGEVDNKRSKVPEKDRVVKVPGYCDNPARLLNRMRLPSTAVSKHPTGIKSLKQQTNYSAFDLENLQRERKDYLLLRRRLYEAGVRERERKAAHIFHVAMDKYERQQAILRKHKFLEEKQRRKLQMKEERRTAKNKKILDQWYFLILHGLYIPDDESSQHESTSEDSSDFFIDSDEEDEGKSDNVETDNETRALVVGKAANNVNDHINDAEPDQMFVEMEPQENPRLAADAVTIPNVIPVIDTESRQNVTPFSAGAPIDGNHTALATSIASNFGSSTTGHSSTAELSGSNNGGMVSPSIDSGGTVSPSVASVSPTNRPQSAVLYMSGGALSGDESGPEEGEGGERKSKKKKKKHRKVDDETHSNRGSLLVSGSSKRSKPLFLVGGQLSTTQEVSEHGFSMGHSKTPCPGASTIMEHEEQGTSNQNDRNHALVDGHHADQPPKSGGDSRQGGISPVVEQVSADLEKNEQQQNLQQQFSVDADVLQAKLSHIATEQSVAFEDHPGDTEENPSTDVPIGGMGTESETKVQFDMPDKGIEDDDDKKLQAAAARAKSGKVFRAQRSRVEGALCKADVATVLNLMNNKPPEEEASKKSRKSTKKRLFKPRTIRSNQNLDEFKVDGDLRGDADKYDGSLLDMDDGQATPQDVSRTPQKVSRLASLDGNAAPSGGAQSSDLLRALPVGRPDASDLPSSYAGERVVEGGAKEVDSASNPTNNDTAPVGPAMGREFMSLPTVPDEQAFFLEVIARGGAPSGGSDKEVSDLDAIMDDLVDRPGTASKAVVVRDDGGKQVNHLISKDHMHPEVTRSDSAGLSGIRSTGEKIVFGDDDETEVRKNGKARPYRKNKRRSTDGQKGHRSGSSSIDRKEIAGGKRNSTGPSKRGSAKGAVHTRSSAGSISRSEKMPNILASIQTRRSRKASADSTGGDFKVGVVPSEFSAQGSVIIDDGRGTVSRSQEARAKKSKKRRKARKNFYNESSAKIMKQQSGLAQTQKTAPETNSRDHKYTVSLDIAAIIRKNITSFFRAQGMDLEAVDEFFKQENYVQSTVEFLYKNCRDPLMMKVTDGIIVDMKNESRRKFGKKFATKLYWLKRRASDYLDEQTKKKQKTELLENLKMQEEVLRQREDARRKEMFNELFVGRRASTVEPPSSRGTAPTPPPVNPVNFTKAGRKASAELSKASLNGASFSSSFKRGSRDGGTQSATAVLAKSGKFDLIPTSSVATGTPFGKSASALTMAELEVSTCPSPKDKDEKSKADGKKGDAKKASPQHRFVPYTLLHRTPVIVQTLDQYAQHQICTQQAILKNREAGVDRGHDILEDGVAQHSVLIHQVAGHLSLAHFLPSGTALPPLPNMHPGFAMGLHPHLVGMPIQRTMMAKLHKMITNIALQTNAQLNNTLSAVLIPLPADVSALSPTHCMYRDFREEVFKSRIDRVSQSASIQGIDHHLAIQEGVSCSSGLSVSPPSGVSQQQDEKNQSSNLSSYADHTKHKDVRSNADSKQRSATSGGAVKDGKSTPGSPKADPKRPHHLPHDVRIAMPDGGIISGVSAATRNNLENYGSLVGEVQTRELIHLGVNDLAKAKLRKRARHRENEMQAGFGSMQGHGYYQPYVDPYMNWLRDERYKSVKHFHDFQIEREMLNTGLEFPKKKPGKEIKAHSQPPPGPPAGAAAVAAENINVSQTSKGLTTMLTKDKLAEKTEEARLSVMASKAAEKIYTTGTASVDIDPIYRKKPADPATVWHEIFIARQNSKLNKTTTLNAPRITSVPAKSKPEYYTNTNYNASSAGSPANRHPSNDQATGNENKLGWPRLGFLGSSNTNSNSATNLLIDDTQIDWNEYYSYGMESISNELGARRYSHAMEYNPSKHTHIPGCGLCILNPKSACKGDVSDDKLKHPSSLGGKNFNYHNVLAILQQKPDCPGDIPKGSPFWYHYVISPGTEGFQWSTEDYFEEVDENGNPIPNFREGKDKTVHKTSHGLAKGVQIDDGGGGGEKTHKNGTGKSLKDANKSMRNPNKSFKPKQPAPPEDDLDDKNVNKSISPYNNPNSVKCKKEKEAKEKEEEKTIKNLHKFNFMHPKYGGSRYHSGGYNCMEEMLYGMDYFYIPIQLLMTVMNRIYDRVKASGSMRLPPKKPSASRNAQGGSGGTDGSRGTASQQQRARASIDFGSPLNAVADTAASDVAFGTQVPIVDKRAGGARNRSSYILTNMESDYGTQGETDEISILRAASSRNSAKGKLINFQAAEASVVPCVRRSVALATSNPQLRQMSKEQDAQNLDVFGLTFRNVSKQPVHGILQGNNAVPGKLGSAAPFKEGPERSTKSKEEVREWGGLKEVKPPKPIKWEQTFIPEPFIDLRMRIGSFQKKESFADRRIVKKGGTSAQQALLNQASMVVAEATGASGPNAMLPTQMLGMQQSPLVAAVHGAKGDVGAMNPRSNSNGTGKPVDPVLDESAVKLNSLMSRLSVQVLPEHMNNIKAMRIPQAIGGTGSMLMQPYKFTSSSQDDEGSFRALMPLMLDDDAARKKREMDLDYEYFVEQQMTKLYNDDDNQTLLPSMMSKPEEKQTKASIARNLQTEEIVWGKHFTAGARRAQAIFKAQAKRALEQKVSPEAQRGIKDGTNGKFSPTKPMTRDIKEEPADDSDPVEQRKKDAQARQKIANNAAAGLKSAQSVQDEERAKKEQSQLRGGACNISASKRTSSIMGERGQRSQSARVSEGGGILKRFESSTKRSVVIHSSRTPSEGDPEETGMADRIGSQIAIISGMFDGLSSDDDEEQQDKEEKDEAKESKSVEFEEVKAARRSRQSYMDPTVSTNHRKSARGEEAGNDSNSRKIRFANQSGKKNFYTGLSGNVNVSAPNTRKSVIKRGQKASARGGANDKSSMKSSMRRPRPKGGLMNTVSTLSQDDDNSSAARTHGSINGGYLSGPKREGQSNKAVYVSIFERDEYRKKLYPGERTAWDKPGKPGILATAGRHTVLARLRGDFGMIHDLGATAGCRAGVNQTLQGKTALSETIGDIESKTQAVAKQSASGTATPTTAEQSPESSPKSDGRSVARDATSLSPMGSSPKIAAPRDIPQFGTSDAELAQSTGNPGQSALGPSVVKPEGTGFQLSETGPSEVGTLDAFDSEKNDAVSALLPDIAKKPSALTVSGASIGVAPSFRASSGLHPPITPKGGKIRMSNQMNQPITEEQIRQTELNRLRQEEARLVAAAGSAMGPTTITSHRRSINSFRKGDAIQRTAGQPLKTLGNFVRAERGCVWGGAACGAATEAHFAFTPIPGSRGGGGHLGGLFASTNLATPGGGGLHQSNRGFFAPVAPPTPRPLGAAQQPFRQVTSGDPMAARGPFSAKDAFSVAGYTTSKEPSSKTPSGERTTSKERWSSIKHEKEDFTKKNSQTKSIVAQEFMALLSGNTTPRKNSSGGDATPVQAGSGYRSPVWRSGDELAGIENAIKDPIIQDGRSNHQRSSSRSPTGARSPIIADVELLEAAKKTDKKDGDDSSDDVDKIMIFTKKKSRRTVEGDASALSLELAKRTSMRKSSSHRNKKDSVASNTDANAGRRATTSATANSGFTNVNIEANTQANSGYGKMQIAGTQANSGFSIVGKMQTEARNRQTPVSPKYPKSRKSDRAKITNARQSMGSNASAKSDSTNSNKLRRVSTKVLDTGLFNSNRLPKKEDPVGEDSVLDQGFVQVELRKKSIAHKEKMKAEIWEDVARDLLARTPNGGP